MSENDTVDFGEARGKQDVGEADEGCRYRKGRNGNMGLFRGRNYSITTPHCKILAADASYSYLIVSAFTLITISIPLYKIVVVENSLEIAWFFMVYSHVASTYLGKLTKLSTFTVPLLSTSL